MGQEHKKFSFIYFTYFIFVAYSAGFFPLYCESLHFSAFEIAFVTAAAIVTTMLASPLVLHLAHHNFSSRLLLVFCAFGALMSALPLAWVQSYPAVLGFWALSLFFSRAVLSIVEARAIREGSKNTINFSWVRSWGSLGFIFGNYVFGVALDMSGPLMALYCSLCSLVVLIGAAFFLVDVLPSDAAKIAESAPVGSTTADLELYRWKPFVMLLVSNAFMWISHATLYTYFSLYLKALGWSGTMLSCAWSIGVVAEIMLFLAFERMQVRWSLIAILKFSALIACLRWGLLSVSTSMLLILAMCILHAFTYGAFHIASMKLTFQLLPDRLKDRGQGILASFGVGAGSLLGRLLVGWAASFLVSYREVNLLFLGSSVFALGSFFALEWVGSVDRASTEEALPQNA